MITYTIPRKTSNTGSIHDLASEHYDRVIMFPRGCKYAVVLSGFYGSNYTVHRTEAEAIKESRRVRAHSHKIIDTSGNILTVHGDQLYEAGPQGTTRKANTLCGPYALAIVTGLTYDEVYKKVLRAVNRGRPTYAKRTKYVTGITYDTMETVARIAKTPFTFTRLDNSSTLNQYQDELKPNRLYVIAVTDHYLVLNTRDWTVCDNNTMGWVPLSESSLRRKRVRAVAEIRKV